MAIAGPCLPDADARWTLDCVSCHGDAFLRRMAIFDFAFCFAIKIFFSYPLDNAIYLRYTVHAVSGGTLPRHKPGGAKGFRHVSVEILSAAWMGRFRIPRRSRNANRDGQGAFAPFRLSAKRLCRAAGALGSQEHKVIRQAVRPRGLISRRRWRKRFSAKMRKHGGTCVCAEHKQRKPERPCAVDRGRCFRRNGQISDRAAINSAAVVWWPIGFAWASERNYTTTIPTAHHEDARSIGDSMKKWLARGLNACGSVVDIHHGIFFPLSASGGSRRAVVSILDLLEKPAPVSRGG